MNNLPKRRRVPSILPTVIVSAALPAAILLMAHMMTGILPLDGGKSILISDMRSQYIDFYAALARLFRGDGSLFYSFSRSFGGDFYTLWAYYLLSPFNIVLAFTGESGVIAGVTIIYYLKTASASAAMAVFLCKTSLFRMDTRLTPVFGCAYALCGFAVMYAMNLIWFDAMVILPLLALSLETLAGRGKALPFAAAVAASMLFSFYTGVMLLAFSFIYYVFLLTLRRPQRLLPAVTAYALPLIGGVSSAGAILYPVYIKLSQTKLSDGNLLSRIFGDVTALLGSLWYAAAAVLLLSAAAVIFMLLRGRVFPCADREPGRLRYIPAAITGAMLAAFALINLSGFGEKLYSVLPFVYNSEGGKLYTASICVIAAALLFVQLALKRDRAVASYIFLLSAVLLPLACRPLDILLQSGQSPIGFPYRYSFIISFVVILMAANSASAVKLDLLRGAIPRAVTIAVCVIVVAELALNTVYAFKYTEGEYYLYYSAVSYDSYRKATSNALKSVEKSGRTEKTFYRYLDDALALGYSGTTHYSSMYNTQLIGLMHTLGCASTSYWCSYFGSTPLLDSLFGISTVLECTDYDWMDENYIKYEGVTYVKDEYEPVSQNGCINVYSNADALPAAYFVPDSFRGLDFAGMNVFEAQNALISAVSGSEKELFTRQDARITSIERMEESNGVYTGEGGELVYTVSVGENGGLYMYLNSSGSPCDIYVNGEWRAAYQCSERSVPYTVYLGTYDAGGEVSVAVAPRESEIMITSADFYTLDADYTDTLAAVEGADCSPLEGSSVKLEAAHGGLLLTTIPYESGWRVTVDGKSSDYFAGAGAFICIELPEGAHTVELSYTPTGFYRGIALSVGGIGLLALLAVCDRREKKEE